MWEGHRSCGSSQSNHHGLDVPMSNIGDIVALKKKSENDSTNTFSRRTTKERRFDEDLGS